MIEDVQAMAAIEAAKITADATIKASKMAFNGGMVTAGVALLASVIAGFVGFRQVGILRGQKDIQERLENIEKTKITLELVERRAGFITMVDELWKLFSHIEHREGDVEEKAVMLVQLADRLEKATLTAKYYFDDKAAPVMVHAVKITSEIRRHSEAGHFGDELPVFIGGKEFKTLSAEIEKLWKDANDILFGQTRPFIQRLVRDAKVKPEPEPDASPSSASQGHPYRNYLQRLAEFDKRSPSNIIADILRPHSVRAAEEAMKSPVVAVAEELERSKPPHQKLAEAAELAKPPHQKLAEELDRMKPKI